MLVEKGFMGRISPFLLTNTPYLALGLHEESRAKKGKTIEIIFRGLLFDITIFNEIVFVC